MNEEQWTQVDRLVDGDYMTQVDDAGFEAAFKGVELALLCLGEFKGWGITPTASTQKKLLLYLYRFGNWQDPQFPISEKEREHLQRWNDGVDEELEED